MKLYNTLTRKVEEIRPQQSPEVTIYTCGPTVYDYPHIGNWFTFVRYDMLLRALKANGYEPKWVMNITDVGHLTSDADEGEDKLEKRAKREGKTAWDIAEFYTDYFIKGLGRLNITKPDYLPKATDHIAEQIELIQKLEAKGYTYQIDDGIYYDTSKFPRYSKFARLDIDEQQAGKRVAYNPQKRQPTDFALWKFSPKDSKRDMEWWAPWEQPHHNTDELHPIGLKRASHLDAMQGAGEQRTESYDTYAEGAEQPATPQGAKSGGRVASSAGQQADAVRGSWGFPGWHIECSAMCMKYLGETLDIHSGGIDHIPVHHTNEIAQSEAATGKPFAKVWMHTNHILVADQKIAKSAGNGITLEDIEAQGYKLEALRLHILESHYRSQSKFSWESLDAAQNRLKSLQALADLRWQSGDGSSDDSFVTIISETLPSKILENLTNDLNTPEILALLSQYEAEIADGYSPEAKALFIDFLSFLDDTLGLSLLKSSDIKADQKKLIAEREKARKAEDWQKADELRTKLTEDGIGLRDTSQGQIWYRL